MSSTGCFFTGQVANSSSQKKQNSCKLPLKFSLCSQICYVKQYDNYYRVSPGVSKFALQVKRFNESLWLFPTHLKFFFLKLAITKHFEYAFCKLMCGFVVGVQGENPMTPH